jgi:hypothetical protein
MQRSTATMPLAREVFTRNRHMVDAHVAISPPSHDPARLHAGLACSIGLPSKQPNNTKELSLALGSVAAVLLLKVMLLWQSSARKHRALPVTPIDWAMTYFVSSGIF